MATIVTRAGKGSPLTHAEVDANFTNLNTDLAALANGMVYKGDWDASAGTFPGGGSAQIGWFYYVSVGGTVGGVSFAEGDNIVATADNASTTTYASNWSKHDQTDAVQAVVGLTGSVSKAALLSALNVEDGADVTDTANVTAAGALMDSELTNITAVKALNQGVATTDSPTFAGLTVDTNTLYVDATNNRVGVGTTSPDGNLTVGSTTTAGDISVRIKGDATSRGFLMFGDAGGAQLGDIMYDHSTDHMRFRVNNSERMRIDSSGNVGIGTSSPTADLQIGANPGSNRTFQMGSAGATRFVVSTDGVNGLTNIGCTNDSTTGRLAFRTGSALAERMRIDESGNVGIGTSSPAVPLHVVGNAYVSGTFYPDSIGSYSGDLPIDIAGNSFIVTASGTERMRVNSSGNLGVGTSNPAYKTVISNGGAEGIEFGPGYTSGKNLFQNYNRSTSAYVSEVHYASDYSYYVGGTERMRIDSSGNLLVGTTTTNLASGALYLVPGTNAELGVGHASAALSGSTFVAFRHNNTGIGSITQNGTTGVSYNTSSDYRLKENVTPLADAADRLAQIPVHRFNFIADPDRTVDGFLAHEVQAFVPEAVVGEKDAVDADGNPAYQGIDQSKLVPLLTAALQEALGKIEALEARITALEA